jgi:thiopurine S-methyltransferase
MEPNFWLQKWQDKDIAFHQVAGNPLLVKNFNALLLAPGSRVFVPLCGKTGDIAWLLAKGYRVVGAELSKIAVAELFTELSAKFPAELGITPTVSSVGKLQQYSAVNIDIFVGNIFDLTADMLGAVDAIYDRAALVALPAEMRPAYTRHLMKISHRVQQLVICFDYEQTSLAGPPFAINANEMQQHYAGAYQLRCIDSAEVVGGLKRKCPAEEQVWLLVNK